MDEMKQRHWTGPSWIMSSLQQLFVSGVVDNSRLVMHLVLELVFCHIVGGLQNIQH